MKNVCAKTRPVDNPYEVWKDYRHGWTWKVLKKWQVDDNKPYARWFCAVYSPYLPTSDDYELSDCYAKDIKDHAIKVEVPLPGAC